MDTAGKENAGGGQVITRLHFTALWGTFADIDAALAPKLQFATGADNNYFSLLLESVGD